MSEGSAIEVETMADEATSVRGLIWSTLKSLASKLGVGKGVIFEQERLTVDKDFIMSVLPHRGRMLLLDSVVITPDKVSGFFTVTEEVCAGHAIGENAVFRGVELPEIANQLVGVWYATQRPELIGSGKVLFARKGDYKASGFIKPGDVVQIEVAYTDLEGSMKTTHRGTFIELKGKNFLVSVGKDLKGSVERVELKGIEPPKRVSTQKT